MQDIFGRPLGAPPSQSGDFMRGIKQSGYELKGTGYGLLGLAGGMYGIDSLKQYGLENANEAFSKSEALGKPTDQLEGIDSVGSGVDWLQHGLGYVVGQAVPSILTGGVGSLIGKQIAKKGVQKLTEMEVKQLMQQAAQRGAIIGAGAASYGQEAGSIYPDMVKEGHDEPWRAAAFAVPAAALDVLPEMRIAKKLFPFANEAAGAMVKAGTTPIRRGLIEGATQAGLEGITEAAQSVVERAAAYKSLTDKEALSDYANSAALGVLGGGVLGGVTGYLSPGHSILPSGNPQVDPNQGPTTPTQPPPFQYTKLAPTPMEMTADDASARLEQALPVQPPQPSIILPEQGQPAARPEPAAPSPQIIIPGQEQQAAPQQIIAPSNIPDTRTAYGIAAQKQAQGKLLTPYETYLLKNPPATPKIEIAKDNTVVRPSVAEDGAMHTAEQFGYNMTPKRLVVAKAAEQARLEGNLDEGSYDQIHTLLMQSKIPRAEAVLSKATQQTQENQNGVQIQGQSPAGQEAPVPIQTGQVAPAANAPVGNASVQEGRNGQGQTRLLEPTTPQKVVKQEAAPVKEAKPKPVQKPKVEAPVVSPKEFYEDNHQDGEPKYEDLSKEDKAIWDDSVANGTASADSYDKFQRRIKRNEAAAKRTSKAVEEDEGESTPSMHGTIRAIPDVLKKAPRKVLNKIKVKLDNGKTVGVKEALSSIDKEIEGYKTILKCVG